MLLFYKYEEKRRLLDIRNGEIYKPIKGYEKNWERFTQALENEGVALVDKGKNPRWMEIFTSLKTRILLKD